MPDLRVGAAEKALTEAKGNSRTDAARDARAEARFGTKDIGSEILLDRVKTTTWLRFTLAPVVFCKVWRFVLVLAIPLDSMGESAPDHCILLITPYEPVIHFQTKD